MLRLLKPAAPLLVAAAIGCGGDDNSSPSPPSTQNPSAKSSGARKDLVRGDYFDLAKAQCAADAPVNESSEVYAKDFAHRFFEREGWSDAIRGCLSGLERTTARP